MPAADSWWRRWDIRLAHFGKNHPFTAASYNSYSRVLRIRDELIEAEKEVGKAIVINRKVYGSNGLPLAANLNELGAVRLYQGDFSGALKAAERGLAILKKCGVIADDPNTSRLLDVKGRALLGLGKLGPANTALSQAVKLDQKQVGRRPSQVRNPPGQPRDRAGRAEESGRSRAGLPGGRARLRAGAGPGRPSQPDRYLRESRVRCWRRPAISRPRRIHLCKALGLNQQLRGAGHTLVGNDHANLGYLYYATGDRAAACEQFKKALEIYVANVKCKRLPKKHPYIAQAQVVAEAGPMLRKTL